MARAGCFLLLLFSFAVPVHAHEVSKPRVLVITPGAGSLEIRVNEMWPAGEPSNSFRRALDSDRDGRLSYEEQERLRIAAATAATEHIQVLDANGKPLELTRAAVKVRGAVKVEAAAELNVDVGLTVALSPDKKGRFAVSVIDYRTDDHVVEAAITTPEGVALLASSLGEMGPEGRIVTGIQLTKQKPLRLLWRESR